MHQNDNETFLRLLKFVKTIKIIGCFWYLGLLISSAVMMIINYHYLLIMIAIFASLNLLENFYYVKFAIRMFFPRETHSAMLKMVTFTQVMLSFYIIFYIISGSMQGYYNFVFSFVCYEWVLTVCSPVCFKICFPRVQLVFVQVPNQEQPQSLVLTSSDIESQVGFLKFSELEQSKKKFSTCSICLEDFRDDTEIVLLRCNHYYCKSCGQNWISEHVTCPNCRVTLINV